MQIDDKTVTVKPKNFFKPNTPGTIRKVGDWLLLLGGVGTVIAAAPAAVIPIWLFKTGIYLSMAGGTGKLLSKLFGFKPVEEK